MIDYGKRDVLGLQVDAVDVEAAVARIGYFADRRRPYVVGALAVHGTIETNHDPRLRDALNQFDLVMPDGQPLRWFLNRTYGLDLPEKVPGPQVTELLIARAAERGQSVFFYGSTPETLDAMRLNLRDTYGDRLEVHLQPSRFAPAGPEEILAIAEQINRSGASLCFAGLGCPRQERFAAAIGPHLDMPVVAVGAAFDYIAGNIERAPDAVQRAGLEWAYRLLQDPRRLARRYLVTNSEFIARSVRARGGALLGRTTVPAAETVPLAEMRWERVDA